MNTAREVFTENNRNETGNGDLMEGIKNDYDVITSPTSLPVESEEM